jgi:ribosome biogenesis protein BRX1
MGRKPSKTQKKVKTENIDGNLIEETKEESSLIENKNLSLTQGLHGEDEEEFDAEPAKFISDGRYRNKQRCLALCSRGVTARYRHLLEDLRTLMPHHKKESKLDPGSEGSGRAINDILQIRSCNSVLYFECRKRQDCYMWIGLTGGPSARFHVSNIHTMDELKLTGNCMKGSRPILSFDQPFENMGHLKLLKELFVNVFGTPRGHPKSKPFVDRIMVFSYADKKVGVTCTVHCSRRLMITQMMSVCRTSYEG